MKKTMMILALLMMAVTLSAQTGVKISAKYKKGDNMLYRQTSTINAGGKVMNVKSDLRYVVTDASPKGYTIDLTVENGVSDIDSNDIMGRMMNITMEIMKDTKCTYVTDADGKIIDIKNYDEILKKSENFIDKLVKNLFAELPAEASQILTEDMLKSTAMEKMTKEYLIKAANLEPTPFTLNGKTISTGAMEKVTSVNDLKMKNMYFLTTPDAKKVKVTSTLDMTKDEMKTMIIDQVKKIMPSQAEMIEQNIDMVMSSGTIKFESEQTTDYEYGSNGWIKTITNTNKSNTIGTVSESTSKIELVESNR